MSDADVAIVGAGVVGLACAARFAAKGASVLVLDQHRQFGVETSSRNSGVIHAGLYYPPGTLKAQLCVEGRQLLYARCKRLGITHRRLGKLVVASRPEQTSKLEEIQQRGLNNGAGDLELFGAQAAAKLEPDVRAVAALWSPETGSVDSHELMASYKAEALEHGALFSFGTKVVGLERQRANWLLRTRDADGDEYAVEVGALVNSGGLHAERIARLAGLDTAQLGLTYHYCKGDYFALSPRWSGKIKHLVYPVPVRAGLGIHLTLDVSGRVIAGPDTTYVDTLNYDVDEAKRASFAEAVRTYLPGLKDEDLSPDYAGIRPKLQGPNDAFRDFVVREESENGAPGFVNLMGIESPGLTASEALARRAFALL